jgi:LCP family protein required for cell wall assembly
MQRSLILVTVLILILGAAVAALTHPANSYALGVTPPPTLEDDYTPGPTYTPPLPIQGTYTPPAQTPVVEIPPAAPMIETGDEVMNILLLGSDSYDNYYRRTDVIILVSINTEAGTAAMWHVPRDLFVYIPNNTMDRINVAFAVGASDGEGAADGFELLQETFRYNFGIEVDHYARVTFASFLDLLDRMGGLDISVDCSIQDWKLIDPEFDPSLEESWEYYTMPVGLQHLDPYMTLWYARSRKTTTELDRGRRQMDVLRAIWQQVRSQGLLSQVTNLWPELTSIVETDMTLEDVLPLVPLALDLEPGQVARYVGEVGVQYNRFFTPDNGRDVLIPNRDELLPMIQNFLTPPTANRLARQAASVEVYDGSWYALGYQFVASDRLAWEGFSPLPVPGPGPINRDMTIIYDYTGQSKGSLLPDLQRVLRVDDGYVISEPDPNRTVDFRVEIGTQYSSCLYGGAEDEIPAGPPITGENDDTE